MLKRCTLIFLSLLLMFSNVSAFTPTDVVGTHAESAVKLLTNLGIIKSYEDDTFRPDNLVTRAEVSRVLAQFIMDNDRLTGMQNHFIDVDPSHWAYQEINLLASVGVISPSPDYRFRPDDTVTYMELFKMLVCVLGYQPQALATGGYSDGYFNVATQLKLAKGISASAGNTVKRGDFAIVIKNAIDADIMKATGYGDNASYEIQKGVTLLTEKMNIYKLENQLVEATEITSIADKRAREGEVIIEGNAYMIGNTNAAELLGQKVDLYYKADSETDENTLIYIEATDHNDIVRIPDKQLILGGPKEIKYYEDEEGKRDKSISLADDFKMIYNGKLYTRYTRDDFNPTFGQLTAIDYDKNGVYDILFVDSYKNIVVDTVNQSEYVISDKFSGEAINVDPNDKSIRVTYIQDGAESSIDNIGEGDVLSVAISKDEDGETAIKIIISNQVIEGEIVEVSEESVTIANEEYPISPYFEIAMGSLSIINPGTTATFYVDFTGAVTAVDRDSLATNLVYGYLINAAKVGGGLGNTAQIKVLNAKDKIETYDFDDRVYFNNQSIKNRGENIVQLFMNADYEVQPQIIKYELNSNNEKGDVSFADAEQISSFAVEAVGAMQKNGIINGIGDNKFSPKTNATRAQASQMIYQMLNR